MRLKIGVTIFLITLLLAVTGYGIYLTSINQSIYNNSNLIQKEIHSNVDALPKKILLVSEYNTLDNELVDKFNLKNITCQTTKTFNTTQANEYELVLISYAWMKKQNATAVIRVRDFILSSKIPAIIYGNNVKSAYTLFNITYLMQKITVLPGRLLKNNTVILEIPKETIAIGMYSYKIDSNKTRVVMAQLFLVGELTSENIFSHILEWYKTFEMIKKEQMKTTQKLEKTNNITLSNWDESCGYLGWYISAIALSGTTFAEVQLLVQYWHKASTTHPDAWHFFLVRFIHKIVPKIKFVAPYKTITEINGMSEELPGQILWDYGPINWGGPTRTVSFTVAAAENQVSATVSYTFSPGSISWGDLSDPARGLQKVQHTYTTATVIPYGYTSTVEPTAVFLKDGNKEGGDLPLRLTHYAWSEVLYTFLEYNFFLDSSYSFDAVIYPSSAFPGTPT
ncbi:MAG: hypothetical protein ACP6IS_06890 [Candidatus Asgardarchaeia archaeon]